jgi:hypothetical protein
MSDTKRKATFTVAASSQPSTGQDQKRQKTATVPPPPDVKFRLDDRGKVHYHARDSDTTRQASTYQTLSAPDFVKFKNAGKRYQSEKVTDSTTMQSYVVRNGQFYEHQKGNDPQGALAANQPDLKKRYDDDLFIKRSRTNRIGQTLEPFDLGHYKKAPPGSRMDSLTGKKENFKANRDHVVSGESLKRRAKKANKDAQAAYKEGLTIAIPNDLMHRPHSATYGGRQGSKDTIDGVTKPRVEHDAEKPAHGFYRDVKTMLDRTTGKNLGGRFDMTDKANKLTQLGAYRKLFKANVKMNSDTSRGINPAEPAYQVTHTPGAKKPDNVGTFSSTKDQSKTMGEQMRGLLTSKLP